MAQKQPGALMTAEMEEQPSVLASLTARRDAIAAGVRAAVPQRPAGIVLIARGSSDNAAIYGRYVLELATGLPVSLAAPSLHTLYRAPLHAEGWVAIAISQSGRTPEITTVLKHFRRAGAVAIGITNETTSPLWQAADVGVALGAGAERAVPATKTFTAQIAAVAIVAEALGPVPWGDHDWQAMPNAVAEMLDDCSPAVAAANALLKAKALFAVGRGFAYPVALEAALKLKETTGSLVEGISAADLRHGPIAVMGRALPVVAFRLPGPADADMADLCATARRRGVPVVEVTCDSSAALALPGGIAEALLAIPAAVRAQQLALTLTLARGLDPDAPAELKKVTATF